MKNVLFSVLLVILISCGQQGGSNSKPAGGNATETDVKRGDPKKEPVQQYAEKVDNDLNNWVFSVKLYETEKRYTYRVALQYEELSGEDEITFPKLGMDPQPVIKKGNAQYECIIGFLDQKGAFREYKKVHVADGNLKITTLKSYAISVKPGE